MTNTKRLHLQKLLMMNIIDLATIKALRQNNGLDGYDAALEIQLLSTTGRIRKSIVFFNSRVKDGKVIPNGTGEASFCPIMKQGNRHRSFVFCKDGSIEFLD